MRITVSLFLTVLATAALCFSQSDSPPRQWTPFSDAVALRTFFREVAQLRPPTERVVLNGQPTELRFTTLQEAIGISDHEADLLKSVAVQCEADLNNIDGSTRALTLKARLDSIAGQAENRQYAALMQTRTQILAAALETLKVQFGSERYEVLAAFISGHAPSGYFPLRLR